MFGNPETTTGGNALKFYASVRLDIRAIQSIKTGTEITGKSTRVKVVKNKIGPPFRVAEFDMGFGSGVDPYRTLVAFASTVDAITKRGSFYSYGETCLGQGAEKSAEFLRQNLEVFEAIKADAIAKAQANDVFLPGAGEDNPEELEE